MLRAAPDKCSLVSACTPLLPLLETMGWVWLIMIKFPDIVVDSCWCGSLFPTAISVVVWIMGSFLVFEDWC